MKSYLIFVFLLIRISAFAQYKCNCSVNPDIKERIDCKIKKFKDGGKLYYQFTCDSIWLTYENNKGKRFIIDSSDTTLYFYNYRIGFQLAREYKKSLLFRSGCPANGPCNFILIDKKTGKRLSEFGELIYDHSTEKFYDFIIYFSNDKLNALTLDFIDANRQYEVPIKPKLFDSLIPEYSFDKISFNNEKLTLSYRYEKSDKWLTKTIIVNIEKLKTSGKYFSKKSAVPIKN